MTRAACGVALALASVAATPPPLVEVRNSADPARRVEARAQLDAAEIRLSGEVRLTLTVEGPGPLGVSPSKPLLTQANLWRVREDGLPVREVLTGGREKWSQAYRLSPLVPGKPAVPLGPVTVRPAGGQDVVIDWKAEATVRVATGIESPSADALRPATDIEPLPPSRPADRTGRPWLFAAVPVLLGLAALGLYLGRRKRPPAAPRDAAWAAGELASSDLTADRCAAVLRQYLAWRFGLPAETRTTPELTAALSADGRLPPATVAEWQGFLHECDAARFSGTEASVAGVADRARALVGTTEEQIRVSHEKAQQGTKSSDNSPPGTVAQVPAP
jgi:hypothetical protein